MIENMRKIFPVVLTAQPHFFSLSLIVALVIFNHMENIFSLLRYKSNSIKRRRRRQWEKSFIVWRQWNKFLPHCFELKIARNILFTLKEFFELEIISIIFGDIYEWDMSFNKMSRVWQIWFPRYDEEYCRDGKVF